MNLTAATEIYTLSLHDALPIYPGADAPAVPLRDARGPQQLVRQQECQREHVQDRKSTRLNSSHLGKSYAVFCLKKKQSKLCYSSENRNHLRLNRQRQKPE